MVQHYQLSGSGKPRKVTELGKCYAFNASSWYVQGNMWVRELHHLNFSN